MITCRSMLLAMPLSLLLTACAATGNPEPDNGWLSGAPSDEARFERLHDYLGGFSSAMWEVGERFDSVYVAIQDDNHALAEYHWGKIADAIRGGYLKRPGRQANSDALFLDGPWITMRDALANGDGQQIRGAYETARHACIGCHVAEDVPFMNDQPRLRDQTFSIDAD